MAVKGPNGPQGQELKWLAEIDLINLERIENNSWHQSSMEFGGRFMFSLIIKETPLVSSTIMHTFKIIWLTPANQTSSSNFAYLFWNGGMLFQIGE